MNKTQYVSLMSSYPQISNCIFVLNLWGRFWTFLTVQVKLWTSSLKNTHTHTHKPLLIISGLVTCMAIWKEAFFESHVPTGAHTVICVCVSIFRDRKGLLPSQLLKIHSLKQSCTYFSYRLNISMTFIIGIFKGCQMKDLLINKGSL